MERKRGCSLINHLANFGLKVLGTQHMCCHLALLGFAQNMPSWLAQGCVVVLTRFKVHALWMPHVKSERYLTDEMRL